MRKFDAPTQWDARKPENLVNIKNVEVIEVPYHATTNLLRYETPEGHVDFKTGGWQGDVYNILVEERGSITVILVAGIGHLGNMRTSTKLIAEYESRAAQVNARLIRYGEKVMLIDRLLQEFVDEALREREKVLAYNERMMRDREIAELEAKQKDLETKKRENGATD